jgi:hypothetical protein
VFPVSIRVNIKGLPHLEQQFPDELRIQSVHGRRKRQSGRKRETIPQSKRKSRRWVESATAPCAFQRHGTRDTDPIRDTYSVTLDPLTWVTGQLRRGNSKERESFSG